MRKRSLIITLILVLLIGGGGVAFYFHLRKQAVPDVTEVDAFLRDIPVSSGWNRVPGDQTVSVLKRSSWLQSLNPGGVHRDAMIPAETYWFERRDSEKVRVIVTYEDKRIHEITIDSAPADAGEFKRLLLEGFPNLRHLLHVNP